MLRAMFLLWLAMAPWAGADEIHRLVLKGDRQAVRQQLTQGISINARDSNGETPLHWAVRHGNPSMVAFLLQLGADPDLPDPYGHTPLFAAISLGQTQVVEWLLERGALATRPDQIDETPLHQACESNQPEILSTLIKHGAVVNTHDRILLRTPLHDACLYAGPAVVERLLQAGANWQALDKEGSAPLHLAARAGSLASVQLLLEAGADPEEADGAGQTPLVLAKNHLDVVAYLAERIPPSAQILEVVIGLGDLPLLQHLQARGGILSQSLLPRAASEGHLEVVRWLLDQGLAVDSLDSQGQSAFLSAAGAGSQPVLELLLQRGADPHQRDRAVQQVETRIKGLSYLIGICKRSRGLSPNAKKLDQELAGLRATRDWLSKL